MFIMFIIVMIIVTSPPVSTVKQEFSSHDAFTGAEMSCKNHVTEERDELDSSPARIAVTSLDHCAVQGSVGSVLPL